MEVLVTGGAGFLGRYIVEALLADGHKVHSFSRGEQGELASMGVTVHRGDLIDAATVHRVCSGKDAVFHVAAKAGIWGDRRSYFSVNLTGTENVIKACQAQGVPYLVHTSTPSVVFNRSAFQGQNEQLPYGKRWLCAYAESKAEAEKAVLAAQSKDLQVCALRPHLIFGPRDPHLLPRVIEAVRGKRLKVIGSGSNRVDVTFVKDAARAHINALAALQVGSARGKAYFISQGEPVLLWDWLNYILRALGLAELKKRIPLPIAYSLATLFESLWQTLPLKGEPPLTRFAAVELAKDHYFDLSNARKDLNFLPSYSMEDALAETIEDLKRFYSSERN